MNAVAYIIIGLGFAAMWHVVYESIVIPSERLNLRFKLFALRDRLRTLKASHPAQCPDDAFHFLDESLSWRMDNLHRFTLSFVNRAVRELENNTDLRREADQRLSAIEACKLAEFVEIRQASVAALRYAIVLNTGGWFIYLFPIGALFLLGGKLVGYARQLNAVPTRNIESLSPACA